MTHVQPALAQAFSNVIERFDPTVTSVMHGHHEGPTSGPNEDPHYAGRAVDVGAFGGTIVGMNPQTWSAITQAIASHEFSKIGTIAAIADNPALQSFARENGVELFHDPGTGPHVHFQVGP